MDVAFHKASSSRSCAALDYAVLCPRGGPSVGQAVTEPLDEPIVLSGADVGFRVAGRPGETAIGQLVVRLVRIVRIDGKVGGDAGRHGDARQVVAARAALVASRKVE